MLCVVIGEDKNDVGTVRVCNRRPYNEVQKYYKYLEDTFHAFPIFDWFC